MIKTIIFDNNGVLTTSGNEGGYKRIAEFLGLEYEAFIPVLYKYAEPLDEGLITTPQFYSRILDNFDLDGNKEKFKELHLASYAKKNEMHAFAEKIKQNYEVALLSNCGDSFDEFNKTWELDKIFEPEKTFVSYRLKMRKPNEDIYYHALKKLGREPKETIFIDDRQENVNTANKIGMNGILFESLEKLEQDLRKHIII